jgi:fatty-acyl-CoA synthase
VTHGAAMVYPGEGSIRWRRCETGRGRALHRALRRADHVHRRARSIPNSPKFDLSSLRTGIMAGAPCPIEVMKR